MFSIISPALDEAQNTVTEGYDQFKAKADNNASYIEPVVQQLKNDSQVDFATNIGSTLLALFNGGTGPAEKSPSGDAKISGSGNPVADRVNSIGTLVSETPDGQPPVAAETSKALNDQQESKSQSLPVAADPAKQGEDAALAADKKAQENQLAQQDKEKKQAGGGGADYPGKATGTGTSRLAMGMENLTSGAYLSSVANKVLSNVLTLGLANVQSRSGTSNSTVNGTVQSANKFNSSSSSVGASSLPAPAGGMQLPDISRMPTPRFLRHS